MGNGHQLAKSYHPQAAPRAANIPLSQTTTPEIQARACVQTYCDQPAFRIRDKEASQLGGKPSLTLQRSLSRARTGCWPLEFMQMLPVEASQACPRSLPISVGVRGHLDTAGLWLQGPAWPPKALNSAFRNGHLSTASSTCPLSPTSSQSRFRSSLLPPGPAPHAHCSTSGDPCSSTKATAAPNQPPLLPTPGLSAHAAYPICSPSSPHHSELKMSTTSLSPSHPPLPGLCAGPFTIIDRLPRWLTW